MINERTKTASPTVINFDNELVAIDKSSVSDNLDLTIAAPTNAIVPMRIADVPLNEVKRDDFSIIDLISRTVLNASLLFSINKKYFVSQSKIKKLKVGCRISNFNLI
jgi:hypothetical protein